MTFNPCVTIGAKTIYPEAKCVTPVLQSYFQYLGERNVRVTDHCINLKLHLIPKTPQPRDNGCYLCGTGGV